MSCARPRAAFDGHAGSAHERAPETDEVRIAALDDAVRLRRIGDAAERDHRHLRYRAAQLADERHVGRARPIAVGHVQLERARVGALREADVIDVAGRRQVRCDRRGFGRTYAALHAVFARQLEPDDETAAAVRAQRCNELGQKARTSREIAAVLVGARVRPRRQELMKQMAVPARDLDAAETGALQAARGGREVFDQLADFAGGERMRHRPAQIVGQRRSTDRFGVASGRMPSTAGILDLSEQPAILGFDGIRPAREPVQVVVVPDAHLVRDLLMRRHAQRLGNDQRSAAARPVCVILDQPRRHARVLAISVVIDACTTRLRNALPASVNGASSDG
jgi:hypothetical protein